MSSALQRAVASGESPIALKELTPFDWEEVHIFQPYTTAASIKRGLGFDWDRAPEMEEYLKNDAVGVEMVFETEGAVVAVVPVGPGDVSFSCLTRVGALAPGTAIFPIADAPELGGAALLPPSGRTAPRGSCRRLQASS